MDPNTVEQQEKERTQKEDWVDESQDRDKFFIARFAPERDSWNHEVLYIRSLSSFSNTVLIKDMSVTEDDLNEPLDYW